MLKSSLAFISLGRLTLAVGLVTAIVSLALGFRVAVVAVRRLVAHVGVDANQLAAVDGRGALDVDAAGAVALAVAAGAVDFSVVVGVKVDNVDVAAAVVLDDLVGGVVGAAADDVGRAVALDRDGVLANVLEPDVLEGTAAQAIDALSLVGADDDVLEGGALFENEDGVGLA